MLRAVPRGTYPKRPLPIWLIKYIKMGMNILISGSTGCGKSYLACALAMEACAKGIKAMYFNMNKLTEQILLSKVDGTYQTTSKIRKYPHLYWTTLAYRL